MAAPRLGHPSSNQWCGAWCLAPNAVAIWRTDPIPRRRLLRPMRLMLWMPVAYGPRGRRAVRVHKGPEGLGGGTHGHGGGVEGGLEREAQRVAVEVDPACHAWVT